LNRKYVGGLKIDVENKRLITILKSSDLSKIRVVSTILEKRNRLYFANLEANVIGVLELPLETKEPK
jgi:hypothetical protein